jgi:hypothetical protein
LIAGRLPGRTSNDVKNYWNAHLINKVVSKKEEEKKHKETMKTHEVIKPRPIKFSTNSPWLKRKHNNFVPQPILASNKDDKIPTYHDDQLETMQVPNHIGRDCASTSKPSLGNVPLPCAMSMDSLWNLEEPLGGEIIGSCSSFQEENFNMEFPNVDDSFWDNLRDFDSLWDLNN